MIDFYGVVWGCVAILVKKNDDDAGCRIPRLRHQTEHDFSYDTYRRRHIGTYEKLRESLFRDVTLSHLTASSDSLVTIIAVS